MLCPRTAGNIASAVDEALRGRESARPIFQPHDSGCQWTYWQIDRQPLQTKPLPAKLQS
jgi:hypothetical protein